MSTTNHWKLGLFVVGGTVLAMGSLAWVGLNRLEREFIVSHYYFDESVSGLEVGSPVKFRGIPLGNVTEINAAEDQRHVEVVAHIYVDKLEQLGLPALDRPQSADQGPWVPSELRVQLSRSPLTGLAFITGDFFDPEQYPIPEYPFEVPFNTVHAVPSAFKNIEEGLMDTVDRLPEFAERASSLMARLETSLDELQLAALSVRTQDFLAAAEERLRRLEELEILVQGTSTLAEAEEAAREIRELAAEMRSDEGPLERLASRYETVARTLEETLTGVDLAGTTATVRDLGQQGAGAADEITLLTQELRQELVSLGATLDSIRNFFELVERDPGALLYGRSPASVLTREGE